jgi:hypothetical protein
MSETTTEQVVDTSAADNSSTANPTNPSADSQASTETGATTAPATASTESTATTNGAADDDAALASFAKGQGINDLSELSDRERSLLKMARDNKSAFDKTKSAQPKLEETSTTLTELGDDATDVQKLAAKVANMEFTGKKATFLQGKDATLEPVMAQIVADKRKEFGDDYARALLNDLPTLYGLAQLSKPADTSAAAEAARREERTSMNQSLTASAGGANATSSKPATPIKVTSDWIRNEYDPSNAEHRALVDAAMKKQ